MKKGWKLFFPPQHCFKVVLQASVKIILDFIKLFLEGQCIASRKDF